MKALCATIQMKDIQQYFHVILFPKLLKVRGLHFVLGEKTLVCDHSNYSRRGND